MRIEFVKQWGIYSPGHVTDALAGGVADLLVLRRIARLAPALSVPIPETIQADLATVLGAAAEVRPEIPPLLPVAERLTPASESKPVPTRGQKPRK